MGELANYELNGIKYDIPYEWQGRHNVRWQKRVNVQPFHSNTSRIRFYKRPTVTIQEQTIPLYEKQQEYIEYNSYFSNQDPGELTGTAQQFPFYPVANDLYYWDYLTKNIKYGKISIVGYGNFIVPSFWQQLVDLKGDIIIS
jgi:hypothetical protein